MCSVIIRLDLASVQEPELKGFTPVCSNDASCGFRPSKVYSCQRPGTEWESFRVPVCSNDAGCGFR